MKTPATLFISHNLLRRTVAGPVAALLAALLVVSAIPTLRAAASPAAGAVKEKVKPSLVKVTTADSQGAGLMLDETGLILTSRDLVAAGAGLVVSATVTDGSKVEFTDLPDAQLVKVHPTRDLALIQVKAPAGRKFTAAGLRPQNAPVAGDQTCYVITLTGSAAPPGLPEATAVPGKVTTGEVEVAGQRYIQLSVPGPAAPLGSAICDDKGLLMGILPVSPSTPPQSEGLVVEPLLALNLDEFVPLLKSRSGASLSALITLANDKTRAAEKSTGAERTALLQEALLWRRKIVAAQPNNPTWLASLAKLHLQLGNVDISQKYLDLALSKAPNHPAVQLVLGQLHLAKTPPDTAQAMSAFENALKLRTGDPAAGSCAAELASLLVDAGKSRAAAYALDYADKVTMGMPPEDKRKRDETWRKIRGQALPRPQSGQDTYGQTGNFDFRIYQGLRDRGADKRPGSVAGPAQPAATKETTKTAPAPLPAGWYDLPLPGRTAQILPTAGGARLIMLFPELRQLGIYDLGAKKFEGFIECPDPEAKF
ncbi:MAG: trypsin-like peptidase domain-containing protein, partial [Verrucomicrobium sp.]